MSKEWDIKTLVKVDDLDDLMSKQFLVHRVFPIGAPNAQRRVWMVRWQSWRAGVKFVARFRTERDALTFRDYLASEMVRTAQARREAEHDRGTTTARQDKPIPSGGGGVPVLINRREPVPDTDLTITLTTSWRDHRAVYTVAVVDQRNAPSELPKTYDTPDAARKAANKLYARLTKEN